MSTLAKQFLQAKPELLISEHGGEELLKLQKWTVEFVRLRLLAPLPGTLGYTEDLCAERFVFDDDAPAIVDELIANKSVDNSLVWETLQMPATNFWIEYPTPDQECGVERIGIMVGMVPQHLAIATNYLLMVAIVASSRKGGLRVAGLLSLPDIKLVPGTSHVHLHWFLDRLANQGRVSQSEDSDAKQFVYDLVYTLFLINTPRVCEQRIATIGSPVKKKRNQNPDALPLIELRRVVMRVGIGSPHYPSKGGGSHGTSFESAEAQHKRLHRVIGHFRTYRKEREVPKVAFVPQHWRGDAETGILLHERIIKK